MLQKFKAHIPSLLRNVECPVCLETIKTPFKLCVRGHGVCNVCNKDLKVCPSCQGEYMLENPVCLQNLLEVLPRFCSYGCEEIIIPGDGHEQYCGFRPVSCREDECKDSVPVNKLLEHYKTEHPKRFIIENENQSIVWPNFNPAKQKYDDSPVSLYENWFWIIMDNVEKKHLKMIFKSLPIMKPTDDYYVCVEFKKDTFCYSYTLKASELSVNEVEKAKANNTKSNGKEKSDGSATKSENKENDYCMYVPSGELVHFINTDSKLEYTLQFFKVSKKD